MKKFRALVAAVMLATTACVSADQAGWSGLTSADKVALPNNQIGWLIGCGAFMAECLNRAAALCPSGYQMVDSTTQRGAIAVANPSYPVATITPTATYQTIVACSGASQ